MPKYLIHVRPFGFRYILDTQHPSCRLAKHFTIFFRAVLRGSTEHEHLEMIGRREVEFDTTIVLASSAPCCYRDFLILNQLSSFGPRALHLSNKLYAYRDQLTMAAYASFICVSVAGEAWNNYLVRLEWSSTWS